MKLKFENISPNVQNPGTLLCQMRWSKNISDERDAPQQILVGSVDPLLCALLNLAVYLESSCCSINSEFVFQNPTDGHRVVRKFLQDILDGPRFRKLKKGNLGTHSIRKGAATYGSRSGVSKDSINRRGRWRTRKSVVDVYIDNTLPFPDAMAAATLTGPLGPCFYFEKPGVQCVTTTLLVDKIAKCIKGLMGESVAKTLELVLLWAALEPKSSYDYDLR
ncbi:hypothetical protein F442_11438 [Phytophthora nicotianae P10297]|uniref:Uncharacterized protein n=3 Tax=Phytophthora nicotianae TaxID=4792 RepID=V9EYG5_PHYNI|nr:hypothetical protein F443_11544 [Phytophthora nicotianae P1569]ETO72156.1 hypothetical protein F444_11616 [Phytophthora nicotianae P1976]ETP41485.1 hypothetical protein F442_11438 [Phytophthora nicotianae P10297]